MDDTLRARCLKEAEHMVETGATVRRTAALFGTSKSSVHKDMVDRLPLIEPALAKEVRRVLDVNKAQRHIRGGQATKRRYHPEN